MSKGPDRAPGRGRGGSSVGRGGRGSGGQRPPPPPSGRGRGGRSSASGAPPGRSGDRPKSGRGQSAKRRQGRGDNKAKAEAEKLEAERRQKEAEEAAAKKAAEEAEAKRLAEIERRNKLQSEYESCIKGGVSSLQTYVEGLKKREALRGQLDTNVIDGCSPLMEERQKFEKTKKALKVSFGIPVKVIIMRCTSHSMLSVCVAKMVISTQCN